MLLAHECQFFARAAYHMASNGGSPTEVAPPPETRTGAHMLKDLERVHIEGGDVALVARAWGVAL